MCESEEDDFFDANEYLGEANLLTMSNVFLKEDKQYDDIYYQSIHYTQESRKQQKNTWIPLLGAVLGITSAFCFSVCSFIVKYLNYIDFFEFSTIRTGGILLPSAIIAIWVNENPLGPKEKRVFLMLRGVIGAAASIMQFYALQMMPLGDASTIICGIPVFVLIFARIFLKEHCGIFHFVMILMTVCGTIFITKPPFLFGNDAYKFGYSENVLYGAIGALISAILFANGQVLLRFFKDVHYSVVLMTFGTIGVIITGTATLLFGKVSESWSTNDYFFILLFIVFSFGGQLALTKAMQLEQAGPVSIYRASDIVFAFIWQISFFHEIPNIFSICGAIIFSAAVILTGLYKWLKSSNFEFSNFLK